MNTPKEVYISYARSGEGDQLVNLMEKELQARGLKVIRDKHKLGNNGSITKF